MLIQLAMVEIIDEKTQRTFERMGATRETTGWGEWDLTRTTFPMIGQKPSMGVMILAGITYSEC